MFLLPLSVVLGILAGDLASGQDAPEDSDQALIAQVQRSVTTIRVQGRDGEEIGIGTGFMIDDEGLVATNFHVINEGRPFTVQASDGTMLPVKSVEASDVNSDLALIRVDVSRHPVPALELVSDDRSAQGLRVLAFGNPLGLQNSVVEGIVSARREMQGRELLQLAMPIEQGNSGGPLVDLDGRVHGIINMKSAIDDNLGFAIPAAQLLSLQQHPNPVLIDRWVRLARMNPQSWKSVNGATWQQRGGRITASGTGAGFGGRSLLLSQTDVPERPFEVAVMVRLDRESGAAGLVFHSDGQDKHYGFYPSAGRLRLTCFRGPSVFSWQVLDEVSSEHYLPGQWNHLKVRIEKDRILCFVNGHLVIESADAQLDRGSAGLAKFRDTEAEFKQFEVGRELSDPSLSDSAKQWLAKLEVPEVDIDQIGAEQIHQLGTSGDLASREIIRKARLLEKQAARLRQLADDVRRAEPIEQLRHLEDLESDQRLLRGALLIARLDHPDVNIQAYCDRVDAMSEEISTRIDSDADAVDKRKHLHQYLFEENGYHGSRSEYYHPANSHLNRVIDDREGLPITLSILYIELAQRLGIDVRGIGLPGHFIVGQVIDADRTDLIDVFDRGELLMRADAERIVLMHVGRGLREEDLQANSTTEILTRVLNNLIGIAGRNEDLEGMLRYSDGLVALNPELPEYRLMRAQLRGMTGRAAAAIDDVDWMLEHQPPGADLGAAKRLRSALRSRQSLTTD
ncbi:trypsin-like serine protease [Roseiconus nitratireducens]|uniref:Trypsin-like serine protease n=1 Tax=Roseiconus nitratireducens TaxID=2605748 RepID=A0A5M6DLL9_9BACT|nr:transglutaminase family protein [Roseiconus nitratireducens]KAA5547129.1 trypsin-like serine protease [Roseiconus nitratireducens]